MIDSHMDTVTALQQLASKDQDACDLLLHKHGQLMRAICRQHLDETSSADAMQESCLKIYQQAHRFKPATQGDVEAQARAWILTITWRTAHSLARSQRRRRYHEAQSGSNHRQESKPAPDSDTAAVNQAMQKLRPSWREVIELHLLANQSYADIAAAHGCSVNAVRLRYSKGLRALRRLLVPTGVLLTQTQLQELLAATTPTAVMPHRYEPRLAELSASSSAFTFIPPLLTGAGLLATLTSLTLILNANMRAAEGPQAETVPDQVAEAIQPKLIDPMHARMTIQISEMSIADLIDFFHDVLRHPVKLAPAVDSEKIAPITMELRDVRFENVMEFVALNTGLAYSIDPQGTILVSHPDNKLPVEEDEQAPVIKQLPKVERSIDMQKTDFPSLYRHLNFDTIDPALEQVLNKHSRPVSLQWNIPADTAEFDAERNRHRLSTYLIDHLRPAPFDRLRNTIAVNWHQIPLQEALVDLTKQSKLTIQIQAGLPNPLISFRSKAVKVEHVLDQITTALHVNWSEAGDRSIVIHENHRFSSLHTSLTEQLDEVNAQLAQAADSTKLLASLNREKAYLEKRYAERIAPILAQRTRKQLHMQQLPTAQIGNLVLKQADAAAIDRALKEQFTNQVRWDTSRHVPEGGLNLSLEQYELETIMDILELLTTEHRTREAGPDSFKVLPAPRGDA